MLGIHREHKTRLVQPRNVMMDLATKQIKNFTSLDNVSGIYLLNIVVFLDASNTPALLEIIILYMHFKTAFERNPNKVQDIA